MQNEAVGHDTDWSRNGLVLSTRDGADQPGEAEVTVKGTVETASPESAVTVMSPVTAPRGTSAVTFLADRDRIRASAPPMTTAETWVRLVPLMVIFFPG